jgi:hypothetical protein
MAIVMGLDQRRAQITADWSDTDSGEVGRARIAPAHHSELRRFLIRFAGRRLEVALEATTDWRFVLEELRAIDAEVHLAEPAETAALRGPNKRAKSDRVDARHLRELLMIRRLPESWIPPDHVLDLRAKVRLRHALVDQRGEWQQPIQACCTTTVCRSAGSCRPAPTARAWPSASSRTAPASRSPWRADDRRAPCAGGADHRGVATCRQRTDRRQPRLPRAGAQAAQALPPQRSASSATTPCSRPDTSVRAQPLHHTHAPRSAPRISLPPRARGRP